MNQDTIDQAIWLQRDTAYLYQQIAKYRDVGGYLADTFLAQIQEAAAHSAALARTALGIVEA